MLLASLVAGSVANAAGWTKASVANPNGKNGTMLLLTDGTVMVSQSTGVTASKVWSKLNPDSGGGYTGATWSTLASSNVERLYTASCVLPSGKVLVLGGKYSGPASALNMVNSGETYDPKTDKWTNTAPFPQAKFGDDPAVLLKNGLVLAGYYNSAQTYLYNPTTNIWTATGSKLRAEQSAEETWVLLPDGSVLSYDIYASAANAGLTPPGPFYAQRYNPGPKTWTNAGGPPACLSTSAEGFQIGPAAVLPNGTVLQVGGNSNTAVYDIAGGSWTPGPTLPAGTGADDAPGAVLPNGHFIFCADTVKVTAPTKIYDYDPGLNTITDITPTGIGGPAALVTELAAATSAQCRMLVLPNGNVLFHTGGTQVWQYTPSGAAQANWVPTIASIAPITGKNFRITGTRLTGISEGSSYGDAAGVSSNYPIVSLKSVSPIGVTTIRYGRTTNWTPQIAIPGDATSQTVDFLVPSAPPGNYQLSVIANGIPSVTSAFTVPAVFNDYVAVAYDPVHQTLTITGDDEPNTLLISIKNTNITVAGGGTTRIGTPANSAPSFTFHYGGNLTVNASLMDGADQLIMNSIQATAFNLDLGSGDDTSKISYCKITKLAVDGGLGYDTSSTIATVGAYSRLNVELQLP